MYTLENIIYELKKYRFCKNMVKNKYLGFNSNPLKYDINIVKRMLQKNKIYFSKKESEQRLCGMAYETLKKDLKRIVKKYFGFKNILYLYMS